MNDRICVIVPLNPSQGVQEQVENLLALAPAQLDLVIMGNHESQWLIEDLLNYRPQVRFVSQPEVRFCRGKGIVL